MDIRFFQNSHILLKAIKAKAKEELIAPVGKSFPLLSHFTVLDNLTLILEVSNLSGRTLYLAGETALNDLGIGSLKNKYPGELSNQDMLKVLFIRAYLFNPKCYVFEQPFELNIIFLEQLEEFIGCFGLDEKKIVLFDIFEHKRFYEELV